MERILLPSTFKSDLSGQRFGRLVALYPVEIRKNRHVVYVCKCDCCGPARRVTSSNLKSGHTQSCGCLVPERASEANGTHYRAQTPLYRRYTQMLQRCYLQTAPNYRWYGEIGIEVCDRWREGDGEASGFECFLTDMGEAPAHAWLRRRDTTSDFAPENCFWASPRRKARKACAVVERALSTGSKGASI